MALDIYWIALLFLAPTSTLLASHGLLLRPLRFLAQKVDAQPQPLPDCEDCPVPAKRAGAQRFRRVFLQVYLLVMSAEWLQGPYLYSLLRDEKALPGPTVAHLYATSYAAAALSAFLTGFLADRFGRRRACLAFCTLHALSALSVVSSSLPVLFVGRVLAGVALTLLWTVFESWMVTEYKARELEGSGVELSAIFGIMTTGNCAAAILGGVLGHCIVLTTGSMANPFLAGILMETAGAVLMIRNWNENYGGDAVVDDLEELIQKGQRRWWPPGDIRVCLMTYVSCIFEGTNFLVLYYWPGMLQDARARGIPGDGGVIPYGIVFACFMATMILGALTFTFLVKERDGCGIWARALSTVTADTLLPAAVFLAGASLAALPVVDSELSIFGALLGFEVSNGIYIPCIAYQRGRIVKDSGRAATYATMKVPLFVFVMSSISRAADGDVGRRTPSLVAGAALLLTAAAASTGLAMGPTICRVPTDEVDKDGHQPLGEVPKSEPAGVR